ncbi:hypothetical protein [Nostoc sp.]|uniref:hypothetical protein n=1 Tax=Nostoc sp. TaxID=1180 RepID=UPI002FF84D62
MDYLEKTIALNLTQSECDVYDVTELAEVRALPTQFLTRENFLTQRGAKEMSKMLSEIS